MRLFFGLRLAIAATVTLLAVGFAGERFVSATVRDEFISERMGDHRADALSVERAMAHAGANEDPMAEAQELLDHLQSRPGVESVELIDATGRVVAAGDRVSIGDVEGGAAISVARTGRAYGGADREARDGGANFEFIAPVVFGSHGYALEVGQRREFVDARIDRLQKRYVAGGVVGLPLALVLFFLVGGQRLIDRHAAAVARSRRDALTGLGNHSAFQDCLARHVAAARRHDHPLALAILDIDDFKFCNDRLGHDYGDRVLIGVAAALSSARSGDACFRLGGDEFAVVLGHTDLAGARVALEGAIARVAAELPGVHLSVGVAVLSSAAGDAGLLREQADAAVYEAKLVTGSAVVAFDAISATTALAHPEKVRALQRLIDDGELEIAFQPIWDLERNEILGYETLARPSSRYGFTGPRELFELAEKIGKAHQVDAVARAAALRSASELPAHTLLFINVSPQTFERDLLRGDTLVEAVREAGLEPHQVVLELTEHPSSRLRQVVREVTRLRALGFKIALDDVGAGNAGLELLCSVSVDFVKIDRSVVRNAVDDPSALGVLEAVIAYARRTHALVIAEGIETVVELEIVRNPFRIDEAGVSGVRGGQGFLLGRPGPEFAEPPAGVAVPRPADPAPASRRR